MKSVIGIILLLLSTTHFAVGGKNEDYQELQKLLPALNEKKMLHLGEVSDSLYDKKDINVSMIIIHSTKSISVPKLMTTLANANSSVHFIVDRDGAITLQVPLPQCAHHTHKSYAHVFIKKEYFELDNINDHAIGIELVNSGLESYPIEQMESLKNLIIYLKKRFPIRKDMIFGAVDVSTINYDIELQNYILQVTAPHKLFDWEFLDQNRIGVHKGNIVSIENAKEKMKNVLYKFGDKRSPIKSLKRRLNDLLYKINPLEDQNGIRSFPEKQDSYTNEFDVPFLWVIYQFSNRHLPKDIRKNLNGKLEKDDIQFPFSNKYEKKISQIGSNFLEQIKTKSLSKNKQENISKLISTNGKQISEAILALNNQMTTYHSNPHLRYSITSDLYNPFKENVLSNIKTHNSKVTELLDKGEKTKLLPIMDEFEMKITQVFDDYEKEKVQAYKKTFEKEFFPKFKEEMAWTELHKIILKEVEATDLLDSNKERIVV